MNDFSKLTIIVPTLNEADNVATLLHRLEDVCPKAAVLIVDDCSTDGTQSKVLEERVKLTSISVSLLERKDAAVRGITASVIDGIRCTQTDFFAVIDGDLQHPPEVLIQLFSFVNQGFDLAAGARLPYKEKQGLHRVFATRLSTIAAKFVLILKGNSVADPMSGLFAAQTKLIKELIQKYESRFEPKGYKVLFDLLRVADRKLKLENVFYDFSVRGAGKSKLKPAHALFFVRSLFK